MPPAKYLLSENRWRKRRGSSAPPPLMMLVRAGHLLEGAVVVIPSRTPLPQLLPFLQQLRH